MPAFFSALSHEYNPVQGYMTYNVNAAIAFPNCTTVRGFAALSHGI